MVLWVPSLNMSIVGLFATKTEKKRKALANLIKIEEKKQNKSNFSSKQQSNCVFSLSCSTNIQISLVCSLLTLLFVHSIWSKCWSNLSVLIKYPCLLLSQAFFFEAATELKRHSADKGRTAKKGEFRRLTLAASRRPYSSHVGSLQGECYPSY